MRQLYDTGRCPELHVDVDPVLLMPSSTVPPGSPDVRLHL